MEGFKEWVTAKDISSLPGFPKAISSVLRRARREGWECRQKDGVKGIAYEFSVHTLPSAIRDALRAYQIKEFVDSNSTLLPVIDSKYVPPRSKGTEESKIAVFRKCPALMEQKLGSLTAAQKQTADARMALVSEVIRIGQLPGFSCAKAVREIVRHAQAGELPQRLADAAALANAKRGASRSLSEISLKRWLADFNKASTSAERLMLLAPGKRQMVKPEQIAWLPEFLTCYRRPDGRGIQEAYDDFKVLWDMRHADNSLMRDAIPSYDQVCYAMDKLPVVVKQKGRITGSEFRQYEGFIRRDWESLPVNYVWIGDGHGMKMKVAHPDHGNPFSPEVTFILDGCCRYIVGWSLALSESVIAVADAMRHGIKNHGNPCINNYEVIHHSWKPEVQS